MSPFFVRRGGHCCRGDLVGRTVFWIFFEWLAKVSLVAVACFLPGRAKDLPAPRYVPVKLQTRAPTYGTLHVKYRVTLVTSGDTCHILARTSINQELNHRNITIHEIHLVVFGCFHSCRRMDGRTERAILLRSQQRYRCRQTDRHRTLVQWDEFLK